jgi:hypothetical protein
MDLFHPATALAVVTVRASCHNIRPDVLSTQVTRRDVIYGQAALALPAVLTGIIITAKDFPSGQLDMWARPMNLALQSNDGRSGQQLPDRMNVSTPVYNHVSFARQEQANSPPRGTNIDRLEISVEN